MMNENAFVQFWGGMRKAEGEGEEERRLRKGGGGLGGNEESDSEEEEGEEGGGKGDLMGMAKKIDLREIEAVLKVSFSWGSGSKDLRRRRRFLLLFSEERREGGK